MHEAIKARLARTQIRLARLQQHTPQPKTLEEQFGNWCSHFNGLLNDCCELGIAYETVRDPESGQLPCFKDKGCTERCLCAVFPTEAEVAAKVEQTRASIAAYFTDLATGRCPACQQTVTKQKQVGRCVYAVPCGHRLFQGSVGKESNE